MARSVQFTVFTPTFNRAHTLGRVYESLAAQSYRDFEWLIVDDGSSDTTASLVAQWQAVADFPVRYFLQPNSGKHIAFNRGVQEAEAPLFLTLDSDDACVPDALERFAAHWNAIPDAEKSGFCGVTVHCKDQYGQLVGDLFPHDPTDVSGLDLIYRWKVDGEKWGFTRTDILREYPYPEDVRNTYIPEGIVWRRIARRFKTRFVNDVLRIYYVEGPSMVHEVSPAKNAFGRHLFYAQVLSEETGWFWVSPTTLIKSAINYSRSSMHAGISLRDQAAAIRSASGKTLWLATVPFGQLLYWKESRQRKRPH